MLQRSMNGKSINCIKGCIKLQADKIKTGIGVYISDVNLRHIITARGKTLFSVQQ